MKRVALGVLLIALAAVLLQNRSHGIAGADRSGYMNLARMLARGERTLPLPAMCPSCEPYWFTPLGFVPAPDRQTMASFYPAGLPLHLLVTEAVSPIAGVLLVFLTFLLGRRLHSELAGLIAAVLMAFCAVLVFESLQVMSDVPAAMWSVAAVLAALHGRERWWLSVLSGFCFGMAVLVRPTSLLLLPVLAMSLGGLKPALRFALGGAPCALFLAWYNLGAFGSVISTGYAAAGATREFAWGYFPARAAHYLRWTVVQFSAVACVAALFGMRRRVLLAVWFVPFFLFYSFYFSYNEWWYTRFLLPAYPAIAVAAGIAFAELPWRRVAAAVVILIVAWQLRQIARFGVLHTDEEQGRAMAPVEWAARHLPLRALVFSHEYSGALLHESSLRPVRFDLAPPDRVLAGYAVLMEHEEGPFLARYGPRFRRLHTEEDGAVFVRER
jgi:4-amino-4-deoxy-L-arabinose transferase-like glycosyltransferase